ncbi:PKD domain-containing protein [Hymenobacter sp. ASUV-10]|uniref:PKD domain-containing protein n=1 Tax=Hymenobacter aranciens TaxID=3063996 RepID=A0ABT9BBW1_9BACT|nr:PKD domain-containing protein [Hymenobacter sp. ASUV-10]MDO7874512.1 PKD domain-containing protein [Hymenobacter sp. ASUV-10]
MQASSLFRTSALLLAVGTALLAGCREDEVDSLEGPAPTAGFTVSLDTTQFPVVATFTNTSTDGFLYQWDFGDGSPLVSGQNVTHTYTLPRSYQVRLVVAGRGGTGNSAPKEVPIPSLCGNNAFQVLTNCGTGNWTLSDQPGAVQTLAADGTTVLSSSTAPLPECQEDDQFSFSSTFSYTYDGGLSCTAGQNFNGVSDFTFRTAPGGLGQLTLTRRSSFIGLADTTRNRTYDIIEATPANLPATNARVRLRSTNADGTFTVITLMPPVPPLERVERLLTGGSSRTWVLDNTVAATIIVGTEAAPASYFAGGALGSLPACQADDEYTFTSTHNFVYNAKAETFVAGVYACQAPRSLTTTYTYGPATGAGLAQFVLAPRTPSTLPQPFIGATDAAADFTYRILSINSREMVIRGGRPSADPVFTIKLRVK